MAPTNKAKAAGVSASSFLDLQAEVAKKKEEFAKNKAAGKATALVGGVQRPGKKRTKWARSNAGVQERASRDIELEAISRPTIETAYAVLQRKSAVYEKLARGKSGGLTDKQYDGLLVDFALKPVSDTFVSDSEDEDESRTVPTAPREEEDDPMVEYQDEYGRTRQVRRSELPREAMGQEEEPEDFDPYVDYNPVNHFPVYEPSAERVAAIQAEYAEENNPLNVHYDAAQEVRAKGAGFYQFSGDEETRRRQMEELRKAREETEKTRKEAGATDLRPGEAEGMQAPAEGEATSTKSRAMEKRKRELEERRKLLDAKRRKVGGGVPALPTEASEDRAHAVSATASAGPMDPFAALEARTTAPAAGRNKVSEPTLQADAFLAELEKEMKKGRGH